MSVERFLRFRAALYGLTGTHRRNAAKSAMGRCGLTSVRTRRIGQLSKGYRQRVGLASAIVHDPRVVILDEPTNGLDPSQVLEVRSLMAELARGDGGRAVLVSSHILSEVERTCDRVVIIAKGRVRAAGTPSDLLRPLAGEVRYRVRVERTSEPQMREAEGALAALEGVRDVFWHSDDADRVEFEVAPTDGKIDLRAPIGRALSALRVVLSGLTRQDPTLETLFIRCVQSEDEA